MVQEPCFVVQSNSTSPHSLVQLHQRDAKTVAHGPVRLHRHHARTRIATLMAHGLKLQNQSDSITTGKGLE